MAADNVAELVAGRPHALRADRAGQFAVDLAGGTRLVFRPADPALRRAGGGVPWGRVTSVEIMFIGDYHD